MKPQPEEAACGSWQEASWQETWEPGKVRDGSSRSRGRHGYLVGMRTRRLD